MGQKLPRKGSNELTDSLLLAAWLAAVAPATADRPSILSDPSLLSPYATVNYFAFGSNLNLDLLLKRSTGVNAPLAEILGSAVAEEDPFVAEPAVVYHHRLAFNIRVLPPFEPAVAAIEPVARSRPAVAANRRDRVGGIRPAVTGSETAVAQSRAAVAEAGSALARNGAAVAGMEGSEGSPSVHGLVVQMRRIDYERLMWSEGISRNEQRPYIEHLVTAHTYSGSTVQALTLRANPNSPSFLPPRKELPPSARYRGLLLKGARKAVVLVVMVGGDGGGDGGGDVGDGGGGGSGGGGSGGGGSGGGGSGGGGSGGGGSGGGDDMVTRSLLPTPCQGARRAGGGDGGDGDGGDGGDDGGGGDGGGGGSGDGGGGDGGGGDGGNSMVTEQGERGCGESMGRK
ncbi:unnamed protein product [Closterium sp. Naga37s-1]|nr:unnamed protein product [Closterium sp. Naga37s-1]